MKKDFLKEKWRSTYGTLETFSTDKKETNSDVFYGTYSDNKEYFADITISYSVKGISYSKTEKLTNFVDEASIMKFIQTKLIEGSIKVYYNPNNPKDSEIPVFQQARILNPQIMEKIQIDIPPEEKNLWVQRKTSSFGLVSRYSISYLNNQEIVTIDGGIRQAVRRLFYFSLITIPLGIVIFSGIFTDEQFYVSYIPIWVIILILWIMMLCIFFVLIGLFFNILILTVYNSDGLPIGEIKGNLIISKWNIFDYSAEAFTQVKIKSPIFLYRFLNRTYVHKGEIETNFGTLAVKAPVENVPTGYKKGYYVAKECKVFTSNDILYFTVKWLDQIKHPFSGREYRIDLQLSRNIFLTSSLSVIFIESFLQTSKYYDYNPKPKGNSH